MTFFNSSNALLSIGENSFVGRVEAMSGTGSSAVKQNVSREEESLQYWRTIKQFNHLVHLLPNIVRLKILHGVGLYLIHPTPFRQ